MRHPRSSPLLAQLVSHTDGPSQQTILDDVRTAILSGGVPPGTAIPLDEVARHFGVSRIPVREVLKTLVGEGLVAQRVNSGYVVALLTPDELHEMYLVRETLEAAALSRAVLRATDADRAAVLAAHELSAEAIRADDASSYHRASRAFHLALAGPSQMYRLLHLLETAWNVTEPVQTMVHASSADRSLLHDDHQLMLDAFVGRDIEKLLTIAKQHSDRLNGVIASVPIDSGLLR